MISTFLVDEYLYNFMLILVSLYKSNIVSAGVITERLLFPVKDVSQDLQFMFS